MCLSDLRHALRLARRTPFLTLVVLVVLAGGIAVTTAVFGLVNAVWLRSLPYPDAARLVVVNESHPRLGFASLLAPSACDLLRESNDWASSLGAFSERSFTLGRPGTRAERVRGVIIDPELLQLLGARPMAGRSLRVEDARPGAGQIALVSERFWRRHADAAPDFVGSAVKLDGVDTTIVGVLPYGFRVFNSGFDVFAARPSARSADDARSLVLVARLAPGLTIQAAEARVAAFASRATVLPAAREPGWKPVLRPLDAVMWGEARPAFLMLLAAALLLLALIVANVSNLLLARSEARRTEFAVRLAVGAGRSALTRQLLAEGLLVAMTAAVLALLLCRWLQAILAATVPEVTDLVIDGRVFGFALSVSLLVGLAFGWLPAASVLAHDVLGSLHHGPGGRAGRRTGRILAFAQLAAASALLTCCGLLVRGAFAVRTIDPGFDTAKLLTASLSLPPASHPTPVARRLVCEALAARAARIPGARSVALTSTLPLDGGVGRRRVEIEGRSAASDDTMDASTKVVSATYFDTIGVRLLAGERPREGDEDAAVVNATLAKALWKTEVAAIGGRLRVDGGPWRTIVGVVTDVRQVLTAVAAPEIYFPLGNGAPPAVSIVIRTGAADPLALAAPLAAAVRQVDPDIAVSDLWSMAMIVDSYFPFPFVAAFLLLSVIALLLSALGLYAVIAFQVTRRTREFGIRLALGADPRRLLGQVLWEGLRLTAAGLVVGGVVGLGLGRVLASRFADVSVADPVLAAAVGTVLAAVSVAACLLPARRATRVAPGAALRSE